MGHTPPHCSETSEFLSKQPLGENANHIYKIQNVRSTWPSIVTTKSVCGLQIRSHIGTAVYVAGFCDIMCKVEYQKYVSSVGYCWNTPGWDVLWLGGQMGKTCVSCHVGLPKVPHKPMETSCRMTFIFPRLGTDTAHVRAYMVTWWGVGQSWAMVSGTQMPGQRQDCDFSLYVLLWFYWDKMY